MMESNLRPRIEELPRPKSVECLYKDKYTCGVLVIGCGFAGLNAAVSAKEGKEEVLVIDKGKPGYSGLSAWASSFRWFDPERGDVTDAYRNAIQVGADYISNMRWYEMWIKESKDVFKRLTDWGILAQYPRATESGDFYAREDFVGYREYFDKFDRRKRWCEVLAAHEIPYLQHTMVTELLMDQGRICGALAFHVPSGKVIVIEAKAVVLATGSGCYRPTGYPLGGDTFDGEYMAYQLGLPIAGKEFEDFHSTPSCAPGNVFFDNHWQYLENIWLCGGDINPENSLEYATSKGNTMVMTRIRGAMFGPAVTDGSEIQDVADDSYTRRGGSRIYEIDPEEQRSGKKSSPTAKSNNPGVAVGMSCHLTGGVLCDLNDTDCVTAVPGLFVAGDGTHASSPSGAAYPCGVGFTSCFCSIDGWHAGRSAAVFACANQLAPMPEEVVKQKIEELTAPLRAEKGFDANWARDVLLSIMAPYWINITKSEETLQAALVQVIYMRDHVIPRLAARSSHDLRLCIEMKHKVLSAEMKLRASLERKESRGTHYRVDYPYRDDENFLCYMYVQKGENGNMTVGKMPLPEEWTGDKTVPYNERYRFYYPGEPEAKGFTPPPVKGGRKK